MQLRDLTYFLAVAETGGFTAAAERLHVVQSGVSAVIRGLERELGTPLFARVPRGVVLTDAGRTLQPYAQRTLEAAREAADAVHETVQGLRGSVTVGTLPVLGLVDLTAAIGRFRRAQPGVSVHARVGSSAELVERLRQGELDAALVAPVGMPTNDLLLRPAGSTDFVALVPADHPFAVLESVDLAALSTMPGIDSPVGFGNRDLVDQAVARQGLDREVVVEVPDAWSIPELVGLGAGVAVVPRFVADRSGPTARSVSLAVEPLRWSLHVATVRGRAPSRATAHLVAMILATVDAAGPPTAPRTAEATSA